MARRPRPHRVVPLMVAAAVLAAACGSGETSMAEYGERLDAMAAEAGERGAELVAEAAAVSDLTPALLQAGLERSVREIRIPLQEKAEELDPPAAIAGLHDLMWDWHGRFIEVERALAARVGRTEDTEEGWTALSDSPEMEAYRRGVAEGKAICDDLQATLDATEMAEAFAGTPWVPSDMQEAAEAALGCQWFPENPDEVYRYPAPTPAP